jgi:hypothetical protein
MSTTWITIAKITGPLVPVIEQSAMEWQVMSEARPQCLGETSVDQELARNIRGLLARIEHNAIAPPIVYFRKYIDPWTVTPSLLLADHLKRIGTNVVSVATTSLDFMCLTSVRKHSARRLLKLLKEQKQAGFENRVLLRAIRESMLSWSKLLEDLTEQIAILCFFSAQGASWLDSEVATSATASQTPAWFRQSNKGTW